MPCLRRSLISSRTPFSQARTLQVPAAAPQGSQDTIQSTMHLFVLYSLKKICSQRFSQTTVLAQQNETTHSIPHTWKTSHDFEGATNLKFSHQKHLFINFKLWTITHQRITYTQWPDLLFMPNSVSVICPFWTSSSYPSFPLQRSLRVTPPLSGACEHSLSSTHTCTKHTRTPTNRVALLHSLSSRDPECLATFNCTEILCAPYKVAVASHVTDNLHAAGRETT